MRKLLATFMMVLVLLSAVSAGTETVPDGSKPGDHFDQDSAHRSEFKIRAYKRPKGPNPGDAGYGNNFIDVKVYDQLGLNHGGLGNLENPMPPSADAPMKSKNLTSYREQLFSKEGLNLATIEISGQVAYGSIPYLTAGKPQFSPYAVRTRQLVKISISPYSVTDLTVEQNGDVYIKGTAPEQSFNLTNSASAESIPLTVKVAEVNSFEADMGNYGGLWHAPAGSGEFKSPEYNKYIWTWHEGVIGIGKGWKKDPLPANDLIITKTVGTDSLSLSVDNCTSFPEAASTEKQHQVSARRRAVPWNAKYSINVSSQMTQEKFDSMVPGHYAAVLNIIITVDEEVN